MQVCILYIFKLTVTVASAIPPGGLAGGTQLIYKEHEYIQCNVYHTYIPLQ